MKAKAHDPKKAKSTPMRAEKLMHRRVKHSLALSIQINPRCLIIRKVF